MPEGLFTPTQCQVPGISTSALVGAMVRVLPRTWLVLDWASSAEEAKARARNEPMLDGSECWYRYFLPADAAKVADPTFSMGMVRHEFSKAITAGLTLPVTVPLDGGGSGFAVTRSGLVLTNYHLVTSEVSNHGRTAGVIGVEARCKTLRAQVAHQVSPDHWEWHDADRVWLVSNPSESAAIRDHADGAGSLLEDVALLRVEPAPTSFFFLDPRRVNPGDRVWMVGFPLRTARAAPGLTQLGYADADGSLRVSSGEVIAVDNDEYFSTDCDGSMGNSGSPVLNESGKVVGLFSRGTGDGSKNAFEYGHVRRVQVSSKLAIRSLALESGLPPGG